MEATLTKNEREVAVLVGVFTDSSEERKCTQSLLELENLALTAGATVYGVLTQAREKPLATTYIGSGKLLELKVLCENADADLVIFDDELSPSQIKNIEEVLPHKVRAIDRTMLILDIFALHAKTAEGILQVKIAALKYSLPRLSGKGSEMSRLGGGIGTRGPGESKLESDRRHIRRKIAELESQLRDLETSRNQQRSQRKKSEITHVAIVGYTNAGKSTLLNALTDAGVLSEDKLFATLDPTVRKYTLESGLEILLLDTVGFINKLPHNLVEAFRSTLDEVAYADILWIVSDYSDELFFEKLDVTCNIISQIYEKRNITPTDRIYVLNKSDLSDCKPVNMSDGKCINISAKEKTGLFELLSETERIIREKKKTVKFAFPITEGKILNVLYKSAIVESVEYGESDITVVAVCDEKTRGIYKNYIV